jgi:TP901 family phage tail tape measure protein
MADIQSNINVNIDTTNALASIKALQSQISAFHTSMARGGAQATSSLAQQQQKLLDGINATGKFSAQVQNIKTTTESFTTALEKNKLSLGQYFKYSVASTKSFGSMFKTEMNVVEKVARERVKSLQTQYINLGRDANGALKAISIRPLLLDLDNMQTKTALAAQKQQILNQLLHQGSTNLLNFGKNTQWAGRQLMVGFTIPLSMAGTAAAKAYMDMEKAAIKIKRVYGDLNTSVKETNQAVDAIKSLAAEYTKYGIAVADTMEMAASAAAMGKTGADLLAQVNQATRLAALGGVEQAQALETTISLTSAFGLSTEMLASKINYLNAVENQTVTSIEDLTIAIPKAGPVVKQLGGDVEDLAFFLTAMREGGINASEGANALKSGLAALINPTGKASEMLAGFGINIKAIVEGNKGDLKKTVIDFATALNTIDPLNRARAIEQMFGKFQFARISTLLQNVTASGSQASKALALANMSSIQLAAMSRKELDRISASPMYKFQKAIADLQVKIAPVGEAFLKAVTPIIGFVSKMLDGFNGMSDQFKNFTVIGVAVLGGLAPVLLMVVGLVANGAANILKFLTQIKSFFNKTSAGQKDLGSSTSYLTTEQIKAEAVAASLDQIHGKLKQTFTSEAGAVDSLTGAYQRYLAATGKYSAPAAKAAPGLFTPVVSKAKGFATGGMVRGPGSGTSDSIPANLSNGEAVIDAETVEKNPAIIAALFAGKTISIPGYSRNNSRDIASSRDYAKFRTYTDATSGLSSGANSALNTGTASPSDIAREYTTSPTRIQGPLIAAVASELTGANTQSQIDQAIKNNPEILSYAKSLSLGIASEVSKITAKTMGDPEYTGAVAKARADIKASPEIAAASEKFFTEPSTYEDDTIERKRSSGRYVAAGREKLRAMGARYTALFKRGMRVAKNLNVDEPQLVDPSAAHMTSPRDMSVSEMDESGMMLGENAQAARDRKAKNEKLVYKQGQSKTKVTVPASASQAQKDDALSAAGVVMADKSLETIGSAAKSRAAIQSPSKEMAKIGEDLAEGAIEGMKSKAKESKTAGKTIYDASGLTSVKAALASGPKMLGPAGAAQVDSYPSPKTQSERVAAVKSPRAASPFMQDVRASAQNAMPRLRVAKQEFVDDMKGAFAQLKNLFRNGGKDMVDATKSGLIQETPRLRVAGKEAGFDYVTALKGGNGSIAAVVTAGNQKIVSAALKEYSEGGFRIAGAVSLGLDKGIAGSVAKGIIAGEKLADSVTDGVIKRSRKQKNLPMGSQGPLEEGGTRGNVFQRAKASAAEKASAAKAGYNKLNSKINISSDGSGTFAKVGAAATTAAFALSGMPGPIGETVSKLLPFMGIMTAVSGIMSMFNLQVVNGAIALGAFSLPIIPLTAAIAGLAIVIAGVIWWMNAVNDAKKEELAQINNTTTAQKNAAKSIAELGKLAGITPGQSRGEIAKTALAAGIGTKQASDVNILLESEEFKDPESAINKMISGIKGMSNVAAKDFLATYANQLKGFGFDDKTIESILNAIKIKANKTDLKLDFASVDINTKKGQAQVSEGIKNALAGVSDQDAKDVAAKKSVAANPVIGQDGNGNDIYLSDIKKNRAKNAAIVEDPTKKGTAEYDAAKKQLAEQDKTIAAQKVIADNSMKVINKDTKVAKTNAALKEGATAVTTTIDSALSQFSAKTMTKANFDKTIKATIAGLKSGKAAAATMGAALKGLGPAATAGGSKIAGLTAKTLANGTAFDTTKAQVELYAIVAGNPEIGDKLLQDIAKIDTTAAGAAQQIQNLINVAKGGSISTSAGVTNPEIVTDTTGGGDGGSDPAQLLKDTKAAVQSNIMSINLMKKGYNAEFIASIAGADAATQKYYTTMKNGIPVLNAQGRALLAAYNTKAISDFLIAQKQLVAGAAMELSARKTLSAAGLDEETVKEMAARADVQAALAAAKAAVGKNAQAKAIKSVVDGLKAEKAAADSLSTTVAQDKFQKTYDTGTKYLDIQSSIINNDFERNEANKKNADAILKANQEIQDLQTGAGKTTGLNQYTSGLSKLQFAEDAINKRYDERAKALDKVATINQRINEQQKGQLSLAQALASGDIAAAAQAAENMNAQNATAAMADQKTNLDAAKQKELDKQVVNVNGKLMTRKEIDEASKVIQERILDIQIKQLDPAQTALDLATRARDKSLKALTDQKADWDAWKLSVEAATTSLAKYNKALADAGPQAKNAEAEAKGLTATKAPTTAPGPGSPALYKSWKAAGSPDPKRSPDSFSKWADSTIIYKSMGGMIPNYYAAGGFAKGTDTVPAMLTPGEFVVRKFAVDNFGVDKLNAINSGQSIGTDTGNILTAVTSNTGVSTSSSAYTDASVYNYNVNVNVKTDSNPDQIASAVVTRINQASGQNIRGNRFYG